MVTPALSPGTRRLWLIGGTQESAHLARHLAQLGIPCTVTVTTPVARQLYPEAPTLAIWVGKLTAATLPTFLQQEAIGAILDASHPFAVDISRCAIAVAHQYHLPYLRFERPAVTTPTESGADHLITLPTLAALLNGPYLEHQRVLLTLGYQWLGYFRPWQQRATLFARILPSPPALEAALEAGFTSDRLVALRPPVGEALEMALWQHWQITCVVTKASGRPGGEDVKCRIAQALKIPLIVLSRPTVDYPAQTDSRETALAFCRNCFLE